MTRNAGHVASAAIVAFALAVAWWIRWGCDDAYITYVYSRGLVYGDGITWFGDHVEGYTNFAWMLWNAAGIGIGLDPLVWSWIGSLAALAAVLIVTYRLVLLRTSSVVAGLCAIALLATNYSFLAFGTSGLETMLQTALVTTTLYEVERLRRGELPAPRRLAVLSLAAAFALWTRLDSAVLLVPLGLLALRELVVRRATRAHYLAAIAPAAILVAGWLAWKLAYYGAILPNTFQAKVDVSTITLWAATKFVAAFFSAYGLWPVLVIVVGVSVARKSFTARLPAALVLLWLAYVIFVGGDFMEFRFFVPILPALFVVVAEVIATGGPTPRWASPAIRSAVLVAVLAVYSYRHGTTFDGAEDGFFDSVPKMATFYGKIEDNDWGRLGTHIGDVLADSGASLACNGAGAIPYFADLPTVDQLGLNDRWVARHGAKPKQQYARPGHQRFATHDYLAERKVTFVIGTPVLIRRGILRYGLSPGVLYWIERLLGPTGVKGDSVVAVAAPVDEEKAILLWYLTPTPEITERIRNAGWEINEMFRR